jgi:hypothetical protein
LSDTRTETVAPAAFEPVRPTTAAVGSPSAYDPGAKLILIWVALGTLLLALLAVVFWLPGRVTPALPTSSQESPATASPVTPSVASGNRTPAEAAPGTPWTDAQLRRQREEAQAVLQDLLYVQFELEQVGVELWAAEAFAEARATATAADTSYREGDFLAAKTGYESGLAQLKRIAEGKDAALNAARDAAADAIEAGNKAAASTAVATALAIDPDDSAALKLQGRVATLDQVNALRTAAAEALKGGQAEQAVAHLREARGLDGDHSAVGAELEVALSQQARQRFNQAMSRGYRALEAGDHGTAEQAFRDAARAQPASTEPASALREVANARTVSQLAELQRKGGAAVAAEQWQEAGAAFRSALEIDGNVLFAREGLARSEQRLRLDQQLDAALKEPLRLGDESVHRAASELLAGARRITEPGPRLQQQVQELETLLGKAAIARTVVLRSDNATQVTINRVANLGSFQERTLELRPGNYTAVGVRPGFRDTRVPILVGLDGNPSPVTIACTERI